MNMLFGLARYHDIIQMRGKDLFKHAIIGKIDVNNPHCFGRETSKVDKGKGAKYIKTAMEMCTKGEKESLLLTGGRPESNSNEYKTWI